MTIYHNYHIHRMEAACVVNISTRAPLGVAGLISPWNLPLYLLTFKIAPAIMSGGTLKSHLSIVKILLFY